MPLKTKRSLSAGKSRGARSQPSSALDAELQPQLIQLARRALASGVSLEEVYEHISRHLTRLKVSEQIEAGQVRTRPHIIKHRLPLHVRFGSLLLPILLFSVGIYLIGSAVVPILGYYTEEGQRQTQTELIAPIPRREVMEVTPLVMMGEGIPPAESQVSAETAPLEVVNEILDYTNLANWFSSASVGELASRVETGPPQEYLVSIPALKIEDALVKVGGTHLEESLIAYPGTALPGEFGAPVIFGHSVLRKFYNPQLNNPRRYNSIFSTIMTLKEGVDKIIVKADGVTYTYLVQQKTEVKPEDVYILTQQYDAKRLKLVTCVPEGTYLRRGVVTAQLVEVN